MTSCKPISIPLKQNVKLSADEGDLVEDITMYRRIVGSLIYMTITRPYLNYVVGVVSQFMQTPQKPHLDAVRRILRYIKHTLHCGIFYEAKSQLQVHGYTDADWVGNVSDRRSTSGFLFSFGSGVISWSNKKQPTVVVATPLWDKCEGEAHTPKSGKLESFGTPKNSEPEFRGQISSYSSVLYVIEKVLKCRCPKWPRMSHLDIYSPSYGQKKGREQNWQFDSRPLKVQNQPFSDVFSRSATWRWKALEENYNFG
jgi:hypothetical protein